MRLNEVITVLVAVCSGSIEALRENALQPMVQGEKQLAGYTTDLCASVIAISGSPDYRYLQENGIELNDYEADEEFVCELRNGNTIPIRGTDEQIREMRALLDEGALVSSETTIAVIDNYITLNGDDSVYLPPGKIILQPRSGRNNGTKRRTTQLKGGHSDDRRNLVTYEGKSPVLVVRVTDVDGKVHPDSPKTMSNKIFGTYGDTVTMKSQFAACSFDKLEITNEYSVDISKHLAAPGVINVDLPISLLNNDRGAIRVAAVEAVKSKLGFQLPGPFDHVMFVIEKCYTDCGWAAYAYVNSWLSIYQGDNYKYVAVQMHEVGHNLNMAHSGGLDGKPYTDHTCLMGNPYYSDDVGRMCYNPAKSFQIARGGNSWYNDNKSHTIVWNPSTSGVEWSGTIIGIADYKNNPKSRPVVVKLESGTSSDLFVGFNRARGVNIDVAKARDEVVVVESGNDGLGYSQSFLKATLQQGESYHVPNWYGSDHSLQIRVNKINLEANPGYAEVRISFGTISTDRPTEKPTSKPTLVPTLKPTLRPTPIPTRSPTKEPTTKPTLMPTKTPSRKPSPSPTVSPTHLCRNSVCEIVENSDTCPIDCAGREIQTTFEYRLGSRGNMFIVKALRDITILSFAINANSRGTGGVKVYTRVGSYSGHEQSSDGWELIYDNPSLAHKRRGEPTELGEFETGISVAGDTIQSFFVTSTMGLVYEEGTAEFAPFASDESLVILEGIGTGDEFSGTLYSPRVWGGWIRYNAVDAITTKPTKSPSKRPTSQPTFRPTKVPSRKPTPSPTFSPTQLCSNSVCDTMENSETCPADCTGREIQTTFEYNLGSKGHMFIVKALRDITISSIAINSMTRGVGGVKVYTRAGSYSDHEQSRDGWTLIYDNSLVTLQRRGVPTELGNFNKGITIAGGTIQSFFVASTKGLVYKEGTAEFAPFSSDDSLVIFEGRGTDENFSTMAHIPRVWGGIIRYDVGMNDSGVPKVQQTLYPTTSPDSCGDFLCTRRESSETCPIDCSEKEIQTTFQYNLGSKGNMFMVKALRDVVISSFAINSMSRGVGEVKVYTRAGSYSGSEHSSVGWELIYDNPSLTHQRRGVPTELGDLDQDIAIAGGAIQSFFVTSTKGLVYKEGTAEFAPFANDDSLVIFEGRGTDENFSYVTYVPRIWGGIIRYDMN